MTNGSGPGRIAGLDTLRAAAIALVLCYHYMCFVSAAGTFGVASDVGWCGVDLFFVLSGYLIGNQLLGERVRTGGIALTTFFGRRFLRTLPNYYATLALFLLFPAAIGGSNLLNVGRFLTFTQNFGMAYGQTFTHSWSLCIEEQFYVLLPLVVLLLSALRSSARAAWLVAGGAIATGMALRGAAYFGDGRDAFAASVYYSSLCRADELVPGVAIAMLKHFHPEAFAAVVRRGNALLLAGIAWVAGVLYCLKNGWPGPGISTTFGFSLLAAGFALLVLAALDRGSLLSRVRLPGAAPLALWSYAVYLIHKPVFMALRPQLARWQLDADAPWVALGVCAAGILGGWLLFVLVESPCMRLRARWFPQGAQGGRGRLLYVSR